VDGGVGAIGLRTRGVAQKAELGMRRLSELSMAVTVLVALAACSGEPRGDEKRTEAPLPRAEAPQQVGTIEAEVKYLGKPAVETVQVNKDVAACGKEKRVEKIVVGADGGLLNAVVWVADGVSGMAAKPVPKPVLDQKRCEFRPQVVAMAPGEIDILNSDDVLHNIHTFSSANPSINKAQPKFKKVLAETFEEPEIIRVRCDVHSWMLGWIVVRPDPYFGVTDQAGMTRIENVPAGKHSVEVWHPVLGKQAKDIEVRAGQASRVTFEVQR